MSKKTLAAGTSPFAHLLAGAAALGNRALGRRAEEEDPKDDPDAEYEDEDPEGDDEKPDESAEDETEDKPEKGKKAKRAKGKKAEERDEDEDDDAEERAEDDDDDEEMAQARSEGFSAAQARGRKIFSSPAAAVRPDLAAHYAFNETMPSAKAIGLLEMAADGPAPARGSRLGRRMARVVIPNPGTGGSGARKSEEQSFGEMALAAAKKAGIR